MHEELIDIYNENMEKTGVAMKKEAHKLGLWHKSIHCWLFTSIGDKNYVIIQKRSHSKLLMPNYFDVSVAGHYERNEKKQDGFREIKEEFGIEVPNDRWHYLGLKFDVGMSNNAINKEFCEVYFAQIDNDMCEFSMCQDEVDAVVWVEIGDGLRLFSGETKTISVEGITWEGNKTVKSKFELSVDQFIPRTDFYYAKIFTIADLYFKGYKYLYI